MTTTPDYFALFGLPPRYALDLPALEQAYERLSFETHPDLAPQGDEAARRQAQALSSQFNEGYRVLRAEDSRAEHLLAHLAHGHDLDGKALPQGFLQEMFVLQEEVDELDADDDATRERLHGQVEARRATLLEARERLFEKAQTGGQPPEADTLHALQENLNCGRYLRRLLDRLDGQTREL